METEKLLGALRGQIADCNSPEEFFSSGRYEKLGEFEDLVLKLSNVAFRAIKDHEFSEAIDIGRQALEISGVTGAKNVSVQSPDGAIALAEATNWAAKTISYSFYS